MTRRLIFNFVFIARVRTRIQRHLKFYMCIRFHFNFENENVNVNTVYGMKYEGNIRLILRSITQIEDRK